MILGLQIIAVIFALVMVYFSLISYKKGEITRIEMSIWSIIWVLVVMVVVFPTLLRSFSEKFFIKFL